jgi:hypothetical protein
VDDECPCGGAPSSASSFGCGKCAGCPFCGRSIRGSVFDQHTWRHVTPYRPLPKDVDVTAQMGHIQPPAPQPPAPDQGTFDF